MAVPINSTAPLRLWSLLMNISSEFLNVSRLLSRWLSNTCLGSNSSWNQWGNFFVKKPKNSFYNYNHTDFCRRSASLSGYSLGSSKVVGDKKRHRTWGRPWNSKFLDILMLKLYKNVMLNCYLLRSSVWKLHGLQVVSASKVLKPRKT